MRFLSGGWTNSHNMSCHMTCCVTFTSHKQITKRTNQPSKVSEEEEEGVVSIFSPFSSSYLGEEKMLQTGIKQ